MSEQGSAGKSRQQEAKAEGEVATQLICEEEITGNNTKPAQRCGQSGKQKGYFYRHCFKPAITVSIKKRKEAITVANPN